MTLDALVRQIVREELELLARVPSPRSEVAISDLGRERARQALTRLGITPPHKKEPHGR